MKKEAQKFHNAPRKTEATGNFRRFDGVDYNMDVVGGMSREDFGKETEHSKAFRDDAHRDQVYDSIQTLHNKKNQPAAAEVTDGPGETVKDGTPKTTGNKKASGNTPNDKGPAPAAEG